MRNSSEFETDEQYRKTQKKLFLLLIFLIILLLIIVVGKRLDLSNFNVFNFDMSNFGISNKKDKIKPYATSVTIESNNSIDKYSAEAGNVITLKIEFNEELKKQPIIKINDTIIEPTKEYNMYIAQYHVNEQLFEEQNVNFEITNYTDQANNKGETITTTTDNSKVIIKAKTQVITQVEVESVSIESTNNTIVLNSDNKSIELKVIVKPDNATNKTVTWSTSDSNIATVENGVVTARGIGTAIITATSGNKSASTQITVTNKEVPVSSITLSKTSGTIYINSDTKTLTITATVSPPDATNKTVTWKSSNRNVATVKQGVVTAKGEGTATITATSGDKKATAKITVSSKTIAVSSIKLNKTSDTIYINAEPKSTTITATVSPSNATNKTVTWKSSNTKVATVKNGVVTAIGTGTATITATSGGKSTTATITVTNKTIPVSSVTLNKTSEIFYLNSPTRKTTLTATVLPENATDKKVTWKSSNINVATVLKGEVTIKGLGTAVITATSGDKKATYTIHVKQKVVIIVGASQVDKMAKYKTSYVSSRNNTYTTSDNTLKYVCKGGSGFAYQTSGGAGWTDVLNFINSYETNKSNIEFHIYYPLSGNEIKTYACNQITASNTEIKQYATNYNNDIQQLRNSNYNVQAYVVSMHPVRVSEASSAEVVTNENKNSCSRKYRSNLKYFTFNKAMKSIVTNNYSNNLKYISLFIEIMKTNNEGKNFSYKWDYYHTTDGIHWDQKTAQLYVDAMLNYYNDL